MKRIIPVLVIVAFGVGIGVLPAPSPAAAQTSDSSSSEVKALIDRIKEARAREAHADEDLLGDENAPRATETKPAKTSDESTKAAEQKKAAELRARQERARAEAERIARNPRGYVNDLANPSRPSVAEVLRSYRTESADDIVNRIRENRSPEDEKDKAKRDKEGKESVTRATPNTEAKGGAAPDYSRFLTPSRTASGTIGGDVVTQQVLPQTSPAPIASVTPGAPGAYARKQETGQLSDPSTDPTAYQKEAERALGVKAALPAYADKDLLGLYAKQDFSQAIRGQSQPYQRDVRFDPGANLNQVYNAYQALKGIPDTGSILARRDVYVPNSTDYLTPAYRGSIYESPYSVDPFNRNYSQYSSLSQYSNAAYNNLNVKEAWNQYYSREYGVTGSVVPDFNTSRGFDVNTLKQWSTDLRQNYGVDVTPGSMSYGDMYRLQTGLRKR